MLLRSEIGRRGLSQYRIAIETGIKQPSLSKFLNGGSLKIETAGVLLDYLGFRVVHRAIPSEKRRKRPVKNKSRKLGLRNRHNRQSQREPHKR